MLWGCLQQPGMIPLGDTPLPNLSIPLPRPWHMGASARPGKGNPWGSQSLHRGQAGTTVTVPAASRAALEQHLLLGRCWSQTAPSSRGFHRPLAPLQEQPLGTAASSPFQEL